MMYMYENRLNDTLGRLSIFVQEIEFSRPGCQYQLGATIKITKQ